MTLPASLSTYDPMRLRASALREALCILDSALPGEVDLERLVRLHRALLSPREYGWGQLREQPVHVLLGGKVWRALPPPTEAREMTLAALRWLNARLREGNNSRDPEAVAAEIAFLLVQAHPFLDGNGRLSRAVSAWVLFRSKYELLFDMDLYCHQRTRPHYEAIAARNRNAPELSDPGPWNAFFSRMVAYCFLKPSPKRAVQ
jgi:fido (protein-threonine AMPylation protein)